MGYTNDFVIGNPNLFTVLYMRNNKMLRKLITNNCLNTNQVKVLVPKSSKTSLKTDQYKHNGIQSFGLFRFMSMWPTGFEDPVIHKRDFPVMRDSGEYEKKALAPIKSAPNSATCSLFKDPLVQKFHRLIKQSQLKKYYKVAASQQAGSLSEADVENISITTDPVQIIKKAIENARPLMRLEKVRVGSVEYQVPAPITQKRSEFDGMKWIINAARDRDKSKSRFKEKLAEVLLETASMAGRVIQTKNEHHKTCEVNRAYAHFRRSR